ncbi:MAG TPA: enoyl-CoA hydratase/isomerase family protein [Solirubrobacteraceae bacterium]|nr:enoyl-CoA hydratase/isomerase family protein [Solirubrobacteraceae bacterium]
MDYVSVEEGEEGVVVLSVDRPPANAMSLELLREVVEGVALAAGEAPRALVLAGRPGCFSAGADLKAVPTYAPAQQREMVAQINAMALGAYELEFPVVGAITGHAIAGGLVLALCSDIRVASSAGRYGLTEVQVGVPYPQAAIGVVRAELTPQAARVLALGSELTDAAECERLGVFDEVHDAEDVLPRALHIAARLAKLPPEVYARTKRDLRGPALAQMRATVEQDPLLDAWVVAD